MKELAPREMILNRGSIELHKDLTYGKSKKNDIIPYTDTNERYRVLSVVDKFFTRFVTERPDDRARCPSLCIVGKSGLGKTDYVRRFGEHTYHDGRVLSYLFNSEARYNVFDDIPWAQFNAFGGWKGWIGGQKTVAYTGKWLDASILWGRPSVFLVNNEMDPYAHCGNNGALVEDFLDVNMIVVYLHDDQPLFFRNGDESNVVDAERIRMTATGNASNLDLNFLIE